VSRRSTLDRDRYARREEGVPALYRNGYERGRLMVGQGPIEVSRPQIRSCLGFLRGMKARGLQDPVLVTSDGAPGMIRAIDEVFRGSLRQRCLVHKKRNILAKVPESEQAEVGAFVTGVHQAPTPGIARHLADQFAEKYQGDDALGSARVPGRPGRLPGPPPLSRGAS